MPKDDPQQEIDKIAAERTQCRTMILTLKQTDQMTKKLQNSLVKMLRRYDKLLAEKRDGVVRKMKAAARKP
jgi:hypothetical protein